METQPPGRETVEHLAEEFAQRYRRGERPLLSEYAARYPEHAEAIRDLFPAVMMMEQIAPDSDSAVPAFTTPCFATSLSNNLTNWATTGSSARSAAGGMGIVYEAEQVSLGRHVALKVLPPQILPNPKQQQRFEREARAAARLHHTNIVPVFGVGEEGGLHYYVMQYIQGQGLDEVLRRVEATATGRCSLWVPAPGGRPTAGFATGDVRRRQSRGRSCWRPSGRATEAVSPIRDWPSRGARRGGSSPPPDDGGSAVGDRTPVQLVASCSPGAGRRGAEIERGDLLAAAWRGSGLQVAGALHTRTSRGCCTAISSPPTCCSTSMAPSG